MTKLLLDYGLVLLFLVVTLEAAGLPFLPGEIALISAALLAQPGRHHFSISAVIAVAAAAAVTGYTAGYWLGRKGGRRLLMRWEFARRALPPSERFFERHGAKTVFIGRFVTVLRAMAAWLAGITHMRFAPFMAWNVAGAVAWAAGYGLLAYLAGRAVVDAVDRYSLYAVVVIAVLVALGAAVFWAWHRRPSENA